MHTIQSPVELWEAKFVDFLKIKTKHRFFFTLKVLNSEMSQLCRHTHTQKKSQKPTKHLKRNAFYLQNGSIGPNPRKS